MTFGSLFSGIGGFDLGLERAGMTCAWQVEYDRACRSVLERHWPTVERYDDVRTVGAGLARVDLVCGGFPCQDVSVAGQREGLAGERSGLWFEFRRVLEVTRPEWVLVENVPGLLSSHHGSDFATVVRGLVELGYGVAWRVLDAQFAGLAQRRDRVFIVGSLGNGRAASVLLEPSSVRWDPPPRRAPRQGPAAPLAGGSPGSGGYRNDADSTDGLIAFDTTQITSKTNRCQPAAGDPCHPLSANAHAPAIALALQDEDRVTNNGGNSGRPPNVMAVALRGRDGGNMIELGDDVAFALRVCEGGSSAPMAIADPISASEGRTYTHEGNGFRLHNVVEVVRRLMPLECERLQGFPDGWTSGQKDAPRYRQLGNAVAVPVAEWIGRRMVKSVPSGEVAGG